MKKRLGALEMQVMRVIWERGAATARDVWEVIYPKRKLAYTTVSTVIKQIERKGLLTHTTRDRAFVYSPTVREDEITQSMARELANAVFDGSAAKLVVTLIEGDELSGEELDGIQRLIDAHKGGGGNGP